MKNFIILFLLLNTYISNSQIKVTEKPITEISTLNKFDLLMESLNKDTVNDFYFITYRDYTSFKDIKKGKLNTFNIGSIDEVKELRGIMLDVLENKKDNVTIDIGANRLKLQRNANSFFTIISYGDGRKGHMNNLSKSDIKKLFPIDKLKSALKK